MLESLQYIIFGLTCSPRGSLAEVPGGPGPPCLQQPECHWLPNSQSSCAGRMMARPVEANTQSGRNWKTMLQACFDDKILLIPMGILSHRYQKDFEKMTRSTLSFGLTVS